MSPEDVVALVLFHGGDVLDVEHALRLAGHHWPLTLIIPFARQVLRDRRNDPEEDPSDDGSEPLLGDGV